MLSENIHTLAARLSPYGDTGMVLEPEAVAAICCLLNDLALQATVLETEVQRHWAGQGISEDILRIATLLARQGVSAGLPKDSLPKNGGAA